MSRMLFRIFLGLGTILYLFFLFIGTRDWPHNDALFGQLELMAGVVFSAGLPPLLVAFAYASSVTSMHRLLTACLVTMVFGLLHYVTLVCVAHAGAAVYMVLASVESAAALWIFYRRRRVPGPFPTL